MKTSYSGFAVFRSRGAYLIVLFLVAFLLRFGVVAGLRDIHKLHSASAGGVDAIEFNTIALHLTSGQGYTIEPGHPTSFRAPGMPFFLSVLYRLSYENYVLVYVSLIFIGALTCVVTFYVAREVVTEKWAQIAGLLAAIYLPHAYFSSIFLSEVLFALCIGLSLWFLLRYLRGPSVWWLAAAGLSLGYATLARPIGLLLPVFLAPALIRPVMPNLGRAIRILAPVAVAFAIVIFPWALRNYEVHHHLVLIATNGGSTFYGANNDVTLHDKRYMGLWIATNYLPYRKEIDATPDEYSHDQLEWTLGKSWVSAHVVDLPLTTFYKMGRFWLPDWASANRKFVLMQFAGYTPFGILILVGLAISLRPLRRAASPPWLAIHGILAANLFSSIVFYGSGRFRDSITPVLMIYAALGLAQLIAWVSRKSMAGVFIESSPPSLN
jgi:4-amino-4-deoxy-L-arabinose transferase-like glycosyltransferase